MYTNIKTYIIMDRFVDRLKHKILFNDNTHIYINEIPILIVDKPFDRLKKKYACYVILKIVTDHDA